MVFEFKQSCEKLSAGKKPSMLEGQNIVCISSVDWDPIWTRKQQLMSRLPVSNLILYVEPPITLLSPFKDLSLWKKWFLWFKGIRRIKDNLYLYSPPVILPFGSKFKFVNIINQAWISFFVRKKIKALKMENIILWTYMPNSFSLAKKIAHKLLVYDCVDEHSEYTGLINKQVVLSMERDLIELSDIVFVTSPGLYDSKKCYVQSGHDIYYLPNAADVPHFLKAQDEKTKVPEEIARIPKPVLGFVGVIQDWVDLDLLAFAARSRPDWSLVMIGPLAPGIDAGELQSLDNVYFLGRKDKEELPGYMKAFDVCLNVFKSSELTRFVSPLKFYEYLASGKPVVSVDMPAVHEFSDLVYIAGSREEFLNCIEKALAAEDDEKKALRIQRAMENSWDSRTAFVMDKISRKIREQEKNRTREGVKSGQ